MMHYYLTMQKKCDILENRMIFKDGLNMKNIKRSIAFMAVMMALMLLLSMASCGKKKGSGTPAGETAAQISTQASGEVNNGISNSADDTLADTQQGSEAKETEKIVVDEFVETEENVMVEIPIEE